MAVSGRGFMPFLFDDRSLVLASNDGDVVAAGERR